MVKNAIVVDVKELKKSYESNEVLKGIDLQVRCGTMLALLGPNGVGKTTTVRILSTLLDFDGGTATVEGHDVVKRADKVRSVIRLTGQSAVIWSLGLLRSQCPPRPGFLGARPQNSKSIRRSCYDNSGIIC